MLRHRKVIVLFACGMCLSAPAVVLRGDDEPARAIRDSFETPTTAWEQEQTDATINLQAHDRSKRAAHDGRLSEHFQFTAGPGSSFFYSYGKGLPRVVVTDGLKLSLYVRANRPGVRVYARVILPADTDPDTKQPSFVLVPGTIYDNVDRWQRLELISMLPSIEHQARVIRATTRRPVSLEGAYLEQVVVNLYCGAGETEIFLDELNLGPIEVAEPTPPTPPAPTVPAAEAPKGELPTPSGSPSPRPPVKVENARNRLKRNGLDWLFTAIDAPGADVGELRRGGFDVLVDDINADPDRLRDAVGRGFMLLPNLNVDGVPLDPEQALAAAAAFPLRDSVAFWGLGDRLGRSDEPEDRKAELDRVRAIISGFRKLPRNFSHLTTAGVADQFGLYARAPQFLDIVGVRPNCWGSALKPLDTYSYLSQRRALTIHANPGGLFCAWLPATAPPEVRLNVWGDDLPPAWGFPTIQPEQLRLFTYLALAAGYRGIGYRGDADLTRPGNGRMLLIEMALLNEEIDLFETILAQGVDPIPLYNTYPTDPPALPPAGMINVNQRVRQVKEFDPNPCTRFATIDTADRKGSLLLVTDLFEFAQCQPNQMAMNDLKITVPARESTQAWVINPGGIELLEREKVPGGVRFNIPDYGVTALVLITTDLAMPERIKAELSRVRPLAVQLAIEQAELQLRWVSDINGRLLADGHALFDPTDPKTPKLPPGAAPPNDEALLLDKSGESIKTAREALEREDYQVAWNEARRATRPLRILMYAHWLKAYTRMVKVAAPYAEDLPKRRVSVSRRPQGEQVKPKKPPRPVVLPVASPPLLSFNLLPQHYIWIDWMQKTFGRNLVPSGAFDEYGSLEALESAGWSDVSRTFEGITTKIGTVKSGRDDRKRLLKLSALPADPRWVDRLPPYLDFPVVAIESPEVKVKTGQFLKISVDVAKPQYSSPGSGGVIVRDSIGGEALQFRSNDALTDLTKTVLFRRVPADGVMTVTLGLAGFGDVYFNDFRVELAEGPEPVADPGPGPAPADVAGPPSPPLPDPATPAFPDAPSLPGSASRPLPVPRR
jgi:hypothetical protein